MKPEVITMGPGVIIATATASRNWRSDSQCNLPTTPPYRNGTIARPLLKTNAPALRKKKNTDASVPADAGPSNPVTSPGASAATSAGLGRTLGGAFTKRATNPDNTKSHTISDCVQTVVTAKTPKRPRGENPWRGFSESASTCSV